MLDARESSAEYAEDRIECTAGLCGYCHYCCAYCGRQVYPDGENEVTRGSQQIFTVWRVVLLLKGLRHGKQESLLCIIKNVRMAGVLWTAILMLFYPPQQFTG